MRRYSFFLLLILALLLTACGDNAQPSEPAGSDREASGSVVRGETLPGRLLFVREGVIWQWKGNEAQPLFGSGEAVHPAWSPNGDRIAYVVRHNSFSDLLLIDAEGGPLAQLTEFGTTEPPNSLRRVYASRWVWYPAWHPNGMQIVVAAQAAPPVGDPPADYNLSLALLAASPGPITSLYADSNAHVGRSAFSPDGAVLVFTRAGLGPQGAQQLYRLDLVTREVRVVPGAPVPSYDPAFSPDGFWLAFSARDGGGTDLFGLPSGGVGVPQRLTSLGTARSPAFAPDVTQLAFLAIAPGETGFDLWVTDLSLSELGTLVASEPRRLTTGMQLDVDSGVAWAP
ncbi:PD40 domain-containing protein [Candidatus Chloroploca sp. Khr17]|uniref:TolB family protein n=1 Tax=Candidatus Chloroploca sp. Khr17 TaxID=2496869 RepID=UPI00101C5F85|nr:PD40 domain-containing protein [Candidatus Chloroploca sp. Khr17]